MLEFLTTSLKDRERLWLPLAGWPRQATRSFQVWSADPFVSAGPFSWPTAKQTRSLGASPVEPKQQKSEAWPEASGISTQAGEPP